MFLRNEYNEYLNLDTDEADPAFLGPYQKQSVPSLLDYANYFALKYVKIVASCTRVTSMNLSLSDGSSSPRHLACTS